MTTKTQSSHDPNQLPRDPPPYTPLLDYPALNVLRGRRVILASSSPRRLRLLAQIGITESTGLEVVPPKFAEDLPHALGDKEYVRSTAIAKAMEVYEADVKREKEEQGGPTKGELTLLLAADTIMVSNSGTILEKPKHLNDHIRMLKMLRDEGCHRVLTAVVAMRPLESARSPGYRLRSIVEQTTVWFDPKLKDELLISYAKTREAIGRAGGYAMLGMGAILVDKIEGTADNAIGLPIKPTLKLIEKVMAPEDEDEDEDDVEQNE